MSFEFIEKPGESSYARPWLQAEPSKGFIMPGECGKAHNVHCDDCATNVFLGEKQDVSLEIYVDKKTAHALNSGQDKLYDILVLHLMGGKDIFITVSGSYTKSCFGCSLDALVQLTVPIRELSPGQVDINSDHEFMPSSHVISQVVSLEAGEMAKLPEQTDGAKEPYPVPKELWFLCDIMTSLGLSKENLFLQVRNRNSIYTLHVFCEVSKMGFLKLTLFS